MKHLCLVRHAKASQQLFTLDDIDRPLIERGYKDAHAMSTKLAKRGFKPGAIISSPGIRALSTAMIFARNLHFPCLRLQINEKLYNASVDHVIDVIKELPESENNVIVFGHNPSITNSINLLVKEFMEHVPTCGIACMDFDISEWKDLTPHSGSLTYFDFPRNNL